MNAKPYGIALIVGSVLLEHLCYENIYTLKLPGNPIVLILPILFLLTGVILLIFSKKNKSNDEKDEL